MDTKQHHGIKIGDLVKFKHHIFDEYEPVHLVIKVLNRAEDDTRIIKLQGGDDIHHRANNFVVIAKAER
jgi:hypothetical protein